MKVNKVCTCKEYIETVDEYTVAPRSQYRMPGIYYTCPHCKTGHYIPAPKASEQTNKFYATLCQYFNEDEAWEIANT